jgi:hypothetical protein
MFHVDAQGNTVGSLGVVDDVVITEQGRIGIGTLHPQARLDIVSNTPGAIRIQDGTEGGGKMLTSKGNGITEWKIASGSWYAAITGGRVDGLTTGNDPLLLWPPFVYNAAAVYPQGLGNANFATGRITVPHTGTYRLTLTGKASNTLVNSPSYFLVDLTVWLNSNATHSFRHTLHALKNFGETEFGFMQVLTLNANDEVWIGPFRGSNDTDRGSNQYSETILQLEFVK